MTLAALLAAAAAICLWPKFPAGGIRLKAAKALPTYEDAIHSLANVRLRLLSTEQLSEAQRAAVDTITLAIVNGSDA